MAKDEPPVNEKVTKLADAAFKKARGKRRPPLHVGQLYERIDYGRDGPKATNYNLMLMLTEHPEWQGVFGFDEFAQTVVKLKPLPSGGEPGPLTDADCVQVSRWLSDPANLGASVRKSNAVEAIEGVAALHAFHPVRDYLDGLVWDRTPRLERVLGTWAGAEHNDYTARVGTMVCVSAVARIFRPGCRVNFMLVLEGEQQISKSDFVRQLFGEQWFSEALESPQHKDFYQALQGRWGIEIAEMHSFSRADVTKVKQAITQPSDHYRRSYGIYAQTFKRQCVFVGTTNESEYLTDPTGAARFLPVRVTSIEIDGLLENRDQIWAEAVQRYRAGEKYWVLPAQAKDEQEERYRIDSWEEVIVQWLLGQAPEAKYESVQIGAIQETTITDVMLRALEIDISKHTRQDQQRVVAIMHRLGWKRADRKRVSGSRIRPWLAPKAWGDR
jgi:predicted P-loop ATPase